MYIAGSDYMRCVSCSMVMFSTFDIVVSVDTHILYTKRTYTGPKLTDLQTHTCIHSHTHFDEIVLGMKALKQLVPIQVQFAICVLHVLCIKIILT